MAFTTHKNCKIWWWFTIVLLTLDDIIDAIVQ